MNKDYSKFPFDTLTVSEVFALARESKEIGESEFVSACMEAIRLNKCKPDEPSIEFEVKK